jgi:ribosomal-protein-alanine N-acetyltransferase
MRFKDFDTTDAIVRLSDGLVSVSTTAYTDTFAVRELKSRNRNYLSRWETRDNSSSPESKIFSVYYKEKLVGQIILYEFSGEESKKCNVSYWIDEFCSKRGITTTALKLVMSHAFAVLNLDAVEAAIQSENLASIRVAEKVGFIRASSVKRYMVMAQADIDHDLYVLNR